MLRHKKSKKPTGPACPSTASGGVLKCVLDRGHEGPHSTAHIGGKVVQRAIWAPGAPGKVDVTTYSHGKKQGHWEENAPAAPPERDEQLAKVGYCGVKFESYAKLDVCTLTPGHVGGHENTSTGARENAYTASVRRALDDEALTAVRDKAAAKERERVEDARPRATRCFCGGADGKAKPHDLGATFVCKIPQHEICQCDELDARAHMIGAPGCVANKRPEPIYTIAPDEAAVEVVAFVRTSLSSATHDVPIANIRLDQDDADEPDDMDMRNLARQHREAREAHAVEVGAEPSTAISRVEEQTGMLSVEHARAFLAKSISVDEVREVADKAKAVQLYLRSRNASIESQNDCAEIRLRAERRLGELTAELPKSKGAAGKGINQHKRGAVAKDDRTSEPPTLAEQGIKKQDASKWQQLAKIPDKKFEELVTETKAKGQRLTTSAPLKMVRQEKKADLAAELRAKPVPQVTGRFDVIVIDPPWKYDKRAEDITQRGQGDYPRMDLDAIKALPVADRAEENCILFCWVTNAMMRAAHACLDAWGFHEKTILTWGKATFGYGDWLRGQTEHCILAVKGSPLVTLTNQSTLIGGPVREHSRKPDEFYALVESLCPGTKLEMFAREPHSAQWVVWGNEVDKFATEAA